MKDKLKIALIGCGRVAAHHARSIEKIPDLANLIAVCDLVDERSNFLAKNFSVHAYSNYYEMLYENRYRQWKS